MSDRDTFLNLIEQNPKDYSHRYVYADWLDEHGEHEEADRQRKFEASNEWLHDFALKRAGHFFGIVTADEVMKKSDPKYLEIYEKVGPIWIMKEDLPYAHEGNPFVQLMYFLEKHVVGEDGEFSYLPFETPIGFDEYSDELWEHYEIVSGKKSPAGQFRNEMPPFVCTC